ncbi:hypothetical protein BGZ80_010172 [Entomortierella chlamydospora]|uniref:AB hydrolase-1 domain-containing protein n=1 Tax=Entomortierella chlamydospora TaxID=101097 RepID=A0A9P6MWH1_9FUNG|nr:hypothetical protein BGZ80_010172 [Entomortierella chlamydospora]
MKFTFTSIVAAALLLLTSVQGAAVPPIGAQNSATAATLPPHANSLQKRTISGLNNYSCKLTAAHPRPLLLVHATLLSLESWWEFAPILIKHGYCVFALTYGRYKDIPLFGGLAPVEDSAQEVADFADNILKQMNVTQLDYVGHSQGGILGRYWMKYLGGAGKVNRQLNAGGDFAPGVIASNIATRFDEVVTPYENCYQNDPGVTNVLLQDLCLLSINEHLTMINSKVVMRYVMNQLDPSTAKTANCLSAFNL